MPAAASTSSPTAPARPVAAQAPVAAHAPLAAHTPVAARTPLAAHTPLAPTAFDASASTYDEMHRQVDNLLALGYHTLLGLTPDTLREAVEPLADVAAGLPTASDVAPDDHVPFVVVISAGLPIGEAAQLMTLGTRPAALMLTPDEIPDYRPIPGVDIPEAVAYLLTDVDTGSELCNVTPADALVTITGRGRTPLTIAEGVALVTQRPDMLRTNKCFSLLASRRPGQRVPAIWISGRAPKLGWCWDRNPHTWLGSASAGSRRAAPPADHLD